MPILNKEQKIIALFIIGALLLGSILRIVFLQPVIRDWLTAYDLLYHQKNITVTLDGAVQNPGTYTMLSGNTVKDLIRKAGGLSKNAAVTAFNQILEDNTHYTIPFATAKTNRRVNINTAGIKELESIPYIGEVKAQRIMDYRNNHGAFSSVNELQQITGIGAVTIERIRQYVVTGDNHE